MKFHEDSLNVFQVIEWTQFCDRQTDARGKNNMSLYPKGRRHNWLSGLGGDVERNCGQMDGQTDGQR